MSDELKEAELRGYSRGYQAGRKRKAVDIQQERRNAEKRAFRHRAFLAALPACMQVDHWKAGDKPIVNLVDRVSLAWDAADESLKRFY